MPTLNFAFGLGRYFSFTFNLQLGRASENQAFAVEDGVSLLAITNFLNHRHTRNLAKILLTVTIRIQSPALRINRPQQIPFLPQTHKMTIGQHQRSSYLI